MPDYAVSPPPVSLEELTAYVEEELNKIADEFTKIDNLTLVKQYAEPEKLFDGLVVLADGTSWDPGSGAGYYGYNDGSWTFLG